MSEPDSKKKDEHYLESYRDLVGYYERDAMALLQACNLASHEVRSLHITFLLICSYVSVIVWNTTHEQLLRLGPILLPIISVKVSILPFYIIAPWLLIIFHVDLLINLYSLATKLDKFLRISNYARWTSGIDMRGQVSQYHFTQWYNKIPMVHGINVLLTLLVKISVIIVPIVILLMIQVRFLPFHNELITFSHQLAVAAECFFVVFFWSRISHRENLMLNKKRWGLSRLLFIAQSLSKSTVRWTVLFLALFFSLSIATVPDSVLEQFAVAVAPTWTLHEADKDAEANDARKFLQLSYWILEGESPFQRNLKLNEEVITENELDAETRNAIRQSVENGEFIDESVLAKISGVDLRGRDLRYGNFHKVALPKADFGCTTDDVNTHDKCPEQSQGRLDRANLDMAQLQGARFHRASLRKIHANHTQWVNVDLASSTLDGSDLDFSNFQGAILHGASLLNVSLLGADFRGADLTFSILKGSLNIDMFRFAYSFIGQRAIVLLEGADLRGALIGDVSKAQLAEMAMIDGAFLVGTCKTEILAVLMVTPGDKKECIFPPNVNWYKRRSRSLAKLACNNPIIARRIPGQVEPVSCPWCYSVLKIHGDPLLAIALSKANCPAVKGLPERTKERLISIASEWKAKGY